MEKWLIMKDSEVKCYGTSQQTFPCEDLIAMLRSCGYKIYVDGRLYTQKKKTGI